MLKKQKNKNKKNTNVMVFGIECFIYKYVP